MRNNNSLIKVKVGCRIKYFRTLKNISQEKLAEIAGLHRTYIGSCERGERNITIVNLFVLCESLDITLKDFFDEL